MSLFETSLLICPLCGESLQTRGTSLLCVNNHSFDVARQGYVNLLPVQHKRSRDPGDSVEMIDARGRFLDAGIYLPISDQLNALAAAMQPQVILDAGCGEGYYLMRLHAALNKTATAFGLDISKPAIRAAARRGKDIHWLVASNKAPPLQSASVDLIVVMFGFPDYAAFARVLRPCGHVILVDAGPDHLLELRQVIYPEVRKSAAPGLAKAEAAGFVLQDETSLKYQTDSLGRELLDDLLMMTPHLFRASHEGKLAAAALDSLALTVDVSVRVLRLA